MRVIKQFDKKSIGTLYAFFLAISGFFMGLSIAFANIAERLLQGDNTVGSVIFLIVFNILFGTLIGLISGLLGAIIGYITGYIFAALYNTAVRLKLLRGITMELE